MSMSNPKRYLLKVSSQCSDASRVEENNGSLEENMEIFKHMLFRLLL